jgi:hypothetical protein
VNLAARILCVAFQRVSIVVSVYFVIDSVRKLLDTPSYMTSPLCVHDDYIKQDFLLVISDQLQKLLSKRTTHYLQVNTVISRAMDLVTPLPQTVCMCACVHVCLRGKKRASAHAQSCLC